MSLKKGKKDSMKRVKAGVDKVNERMIGRRGRLFYNFVRRRVARELVKQGYSHQAAREEADELTDEEIDEQASKQRIGAVKGGFLDWLRENGPAILEMIMKIVSLILMFVEKPKKKVAGADEEEESDLIDTPEETVPEDDT